MPNHPQSRAPVRDIVQRDTQGFKGKPTTAITAAKSAATKSVRRGGRPKGAKNKPKALIPRDLALDILEAVHGTVPEEYYREMRDAIKLGKNISTINEAKILLKLMGPPVWLRLVNETQVQRNSRIPDLDDDLAGEIGDIGSEDSGAKETNERLKIIMNLIKLVSDLESKDESANTNDKPILEIYARRGIDNGRIGVLIGIESGSVGGSPDSVGRPTGRIRALSDIIPERQIDLQDSEEGSAIGVFDNVSYRDVSRSDDEGQL